MFEIPESDVRRTIVGCLHHDALFHCALCRHDTGLVIADARSKHDEVKTQLDTLNERFDKMTQEQAVKLKEHDKVYK